MSAAGPARAVICDFGGVLTSPLLGAFAAVQEAKGLPLDAFGRALVAAEERLGAPPLFELERGRLTEADFLARLERELAADLGHEVSLADFTDTWWAALEPNHELFAHLAELRERGLRMVLCTNNVREWEPRWRAMLPIDDVFHAVVDSAWIGVRKPDREIYDAALAEAAVPPEDAIFVDDTDVNVEAAVALGMRGVLFRDTRQAIAEIDARL